MAAINGGHTWDLPDGATISQLRAFDLALSNVCDIFFFKIEFTYAFKDPKEVYTQERTRQGTQPIHSYDLIIISTCVTRGDL